MSFNVYSLGIAGGASDPPNPFGGSTIAERASWAIKNSGNTTEKVGSDGSISAGGLDAAIEGLKKAISDPSLDANNASQKKCDQLQIDFFNAIKSNGEKPPIDPAQIPTAEGGPGADPPSSAPIHEGGA